MPGARGWPWGFRQGKYACEALELKMEPTKTLEGSVQRLSVNQYRVSTLTYGKDQKKTQILIICQ